MSTIVETIFTEFTRPMRDYVNTAKRPSTTTNGMFLVLDTIWMAKEISELRDSLLFYRDELETIRESLGLREGATVTTVACIHEMQRQLALLSNPYTSVAPACEWAYDVQHDAWDTSCGLLWCFTNDDTLEGNFLRYCPQCGRPAKKVPRTPWPAESGEGPE